MPKVSIIVPVYNNEAVIGRCIESILNQTFEDFELIIINDGSKDGSENIIKQYAKKDNRIKFINNKNNGVSETRNIGIRNAKGMYIQFVDGDDFIDKNMIEYEVNLLEKKEADMVVTGLYLDIEKNGVVDTNIQTFDYYEACDKKSIAISVLNRLDGTYINSPINKLYKSNIIKENNLFMDKEISLGEDFIFNLKYLKYCKNVIFSDKAYYHYWMKTDNNLTFRFREDKLDLMYLMYKISVEYFKESGLTEEEYNDLNKHFIKWMYSCFIDLHNKGCNLTYNEKIDYLNKSINSYKYIVNKATDLTLSQKILRKSLNSTMMILIISKLIYIIKIKYRSLLYK